MESRLAVPYSMFDVRFVFGIHSMLDVGRSMFDVHLSISQRSDHE